MIQFSLRISCLHCRSRQHLPVRQRRSIFRLQKPFRLQDNNFESCQTSIQNRIKLGGLDSVQSYFFHLLPIDLVWYSCIPQMMERTRRYLQGFDEYWEQVPGASISVSVSNDDTIRDKASWFLANPVSKKTWKLLIAVSQRIKLGESWHFEMEQIQYVL